MKWPVDSNQLTSSLAEVLLKDRRLPGPYRSYATGWAGQVLHQGNSQRDQYLSFGSGWEAQAVRQEAQSLPSPTTVEGEEMKKRFTAPTTMKSSGF